MSDRRPEDRLLVKKWLDMEDDFVEYQPSPADLISAVRRGVESGTIKGIEAVLHDGDHDGLWFGDDKRRWVDVPEGRYVLIPVSDGGEDT